MNKLVVLNTILWEHESALGDEFIIHVLTYWISKPIWLKTRTSLWWKRRPYHGGPLGVPRNSLIGQWSISLLPKLLTLSGLVGVLFIFRDWEDGIMLGNLVWSQINLVQSLSFMFNLSKLYNLSVTQFPHLWFGHNWSVRFMGLLDNNAWQHVKHSMCTGPLCNT